MEILAVESDLDSGVFRAAQEIQNEDGTTRLLQLSLPADALEWRAAEYQIEPTEIDLLMDIVLYETIMPQDNPGMPILYTASSIDEAREEHVGRVLEFKKKIRPVARAWKSNKQREQRLTDAGCDKKWTELITDDALQRIRTDHIMHHEVLFEKAMIIGRVRQVVRNRPRPSRVTPAERARVFRAMRDTAQLMKRRGLPQLEVNGG